MLDLDNFKQVNDLYGHRVGDRVLVETADRLARLMPKNAAIARLGGDEFACVMTFDPCKPEKIDEFATSLIEQVSQPTELDSTSTEITVTIGISRSDNPLNTEEPNDFAETLLHRADIAMYHAKREGRNRHAWFESTMESELRLRNELEIGIRRGIPRGEFVPYYEQQIDLETGKLAGFEMLARWHSPSLGIVNPETFIPIAEDIEVISELSECLITQALRDANEWDSDLTLSVNISPVQLRDPWFSQKLLRLLIESGFPPHRLEIEITESCLHENIGVVRSILVSLKNQGIKINLDDFGTGYSSLAQLRSLPFDRIKIDRSFVKDLGMEGSDSKIVEAIVSLGRGLNLPITAEGIESDTALNELRKMGQMKGQGYLYGHPETASETRDRLAAQNLLADTDGGQAQDLVSKPDSPTSKPPKSTPKRRASS